MTPLFRGDWLVLCQVHLVLCSSKLAQPFWSASSLKVRLLCPMLKTQFFRKDPQHYTYTLGRKWELGSQTAFTSGSCLLLLEFHQAVRYKKLHLHVVSTDAEFGRWSLWQTHSTYMRFASSSGPATFRLLLGTDISSVLWGVHSSGEENAYLAIQG